MHWSLPIHILNILNNIIPLAGMLSKLRGQILLVATALHILFHVGSPDKVNSELSDDAISAAIDFVGLCCQQTPYMATLP